MQHLIAPRAEQGDFTTLVCSLNRIGSDWEAVAEVDCKTLPDAIATLTEHVASLRSDMVAATESAVSGASRDDLVDALADIGFITVCIHLTELELLRLQSI